MPVAGSVSREPLGLPTQFGFNSSSEGHAKPRQTLLATTPATQPRTRLKTELAHYPSATLAEPFFGKFGSRQGTSNHCLNQARQIFEPNRLDFLIQRIVFFARINDKQFREVQIIDGTDHGSGF